MITTCWQRNSPLGFDCASVATWRNAFISGGARSANPSRHLSEREKLKCRPEQLRMQQGLKRDPYAFHFLLILRASGVIGSSSARTAQGKQFAVERVTISLRLNAFPARFARSGLSQCQSQNTKLSPDALCNPALDCNRVVDWLVPVQRAPRRGRLQKQVGQHRFDIATIYCLHVTRAAKIAV
jgi:hypothetical protein